MDVAAATRRVLIVTPNRVVGEDLRELMMEYPGVHAEVRSKLEIPWGEGYDLAFFGFPLELLLDDTRVMALHGSGTRLVALNGHVPAGAYAGTGIEPLHQPFRSEDVKALLVRIGIDFSA